VVETVEAFQLFGPGIWWIGLTIDRAAAQGMPDESRVLSRAIWGIPDPAIPAGLAGQPADRVE